MDLIVPPRGSTEVKIMIFNRMCQKNYMNFIKIHISWYLNPIFMLFMSKNSQNSHFLSVLTVQSWKKKWNFSINKFHSLIKHFKTFFYPKIIIF